VLTCTIASGNHKLSLLMIGISKKPRISKIWKTFPQHIWTRREIGWIMISFSSGWQLFYFQSKKIQ
jgi:hypothetical protein